MEVNSFPFERLCTTLASGTRPDWGIPGPKPGLGPGWPGDEKSGEAVATGPARLGLAAAGLGQNWPSLLRKMKKNLGQHGLAGLHSPDSGTLRIN